MNKEKLSNSLHIGGTIETAISGQYTLKAGPVLQEALSITCKHFWQFLPAILLLSLANALLLMLTLFLYVDSPKEVLIAYAGRADMTPEILLQGQVSMLISTILNAPLYAGASLMGLSHAIGFKTKTRHLLKGMAYAFPVILSMGAITFLQSIGNQLIPFLGLILGIMLSMVILLICEKRVSPVQAMSISFRAVSKKMVTLCIVYIVLFMLFIFSYATMGLALIWTLPFLFNVKGILYREMFGVGIEITVSEEGDDENNKEVFNA